MVDAETLLAVLEAEVEQAELTEALGVMDELTADQGDPEALLRLPSGEWIRLLDTPARPRATR